MFLSFFYQIIKEVAFYDEYPLLALNIFSLLLQTSLNKKINLKNSHKNIIQYSNIYKCGCI